MANTKIDWISNIKNQPFADVRQFNFPAQTPGGSLSVGSNVITLNPMPLGLVANWGSLYISGGTGTAEAVPVTAVGANTVTVTCAHTHTGAWTIGPAWAGIQEALNYVLSQSATGRGSVVVPYVAGGISGHGTLYVPPNRGFMLRVDAELTAADTGSADGILFDSARSSTFEFNAPVNYAGTGNALKFYGINPDPIDGINQIDSCAFRFTNVSAVNAYANPAIPATLAYFLGASNQAGYGNFSHNHVWFTTLVGGQTPILLQSSTSADRGAVQENLFYSSSIINFSTAGIHLTGSGGLTNNNQFFITTIYNDATNTASGLLLDGTGGLAIGNTFLLSNISVTTGNPAINITATGPNYVQISQTVNGTITCSDAVTKIETPQVSAQYVISVGGSPFTYQNLDFTDEAVLITGNPASAIQISPDGNLFYDTGFTTTGTVWLRPGEAVKVTYSGSAPTMRKIVKR